MHGSDLKNRDDAELKLKADNQHANRTVTVHIMQTASLSKVGLCRSVLQNSDNQIWWVAEMSEKSTVRLNNVLLYTSSATASKYKGAPPWT